MTQHDETVEVKHNDEVVDVPTHFELTDIAVYFEDVPESFDIDRIYIGDEDLIEAEMYLGDEEWVSLVLQTEEHRPVLTARVVGWVADVVSAPAPEDAIEAPGETVWERHNSKVQQ